MQIKLYELFLESEIDAGNRLITTVASKVGSLSLKIMRTTTVVKVIKIPRSEQIEPIYRVFNSIVLAGHLRQKHIFTNFTLSMAAKYFVWDVKSEKMHIALQN